VNGALHALFWHFALDWYTRFASLSLIIIARMISDNDRVIYDDCLCHFDIIRVRYRWTDE